MNGRLRVTVTDDDGTVHDEYTVWAARPNMTTDERLQQALNEAKEMGELGCHEWDDDGYPDNTYSVLDQNGDELHSSNSWGLACHYLAQWDVTKSQGRIRDNTTNTILLDNRERDDG